MYAIGIKCMRFVDRLHGAKVLWRLCILNDMHDCSSDWKESGISAKQLLSVKYYNIQSKLYANSWLQFAWCHIISQPSMMYKDSWSKIGSSSVCRSKCRSRCRWIEYAWSFILVYEECLYSCVCLLVFFVIFVYCSFLTCYKRSWNVTPLLRVVSHAIVD